MIAMLSFLTDIVPRKMQMVYYLQFLTLADFTSA